LDWFTQEGTQANFSLAALHRHLKRYPAVALLLNEVLEASRLNGYKAQTAKRASGE
jgi:hypothetical protein